MFKRILAGLVLAFAVFSAQAGVVTLTDFSINWDNPTSIRESGGTATVLWDLNNDYTWDKSFQVNIAPFTDALIASGNGIKNWITSIDGSGMSFTPWDLYEISGDYGESFITSNGEGRTLGRYGSHGLLFTSYGGSSWNITQTDQVSTVPTPPSLLLTMTGLMGLLVAKKRKTELPT